jgi:hypothetical protein
MCVSEGKTIISESGEFVDCPLVSRNRVMSVLVFRAISSPTTVSGIIVFAAALRQSLSNLSSCAEQREEHPAEAAAVAARKGLEDCLDHSRR